MQKETIWKISDIEKENEKLKLKIKHAYQQDRVFDADLYEYDLNKNKQKLKKLISMSYEKIKSIDHLKNLCKDKQEDFFIHMGLLRSHKTICFDTFDQKFYVFHETDGSTEITDEKLIKTTFIGTSIKKGIFYKNQWI